MNNSTQVLVALGAASVLLSSPARAGWIVDVPNNMGPDEQTIYRHVVDQPGGCNYVLWNMRRPIDMSCVPPGARLFDSAWNVECPVDYTWGVNRAACIGLADSRQIVRIGSPLCSETLFPLLSKPGPHASSGMCAEMNELMKRGYSIQRSTDGFLEMIPPPIGSSCRGTGLFIEDCYGEAALTEAGRRCVLGNGGLGHAPRGPVDLVPDVICPGSSLPSCGPLNRIVKAGSVCSDMGLGIVDIAFAVPNCLNMYAEAENAGCSTPKTEAVCLTVMSLNPGCMNIDALQRSHYLAPNLCRIEDKRHPYFRCHYDKRTKLVYRHSCSGWEPEYETWSDWWNGRQVVYRPRF
jgi:hypothetical protein